MLTSNVSENITVLREKVEKTADFMVRDIYIGNIRVSFVMFEGMVSLSVLANLIIRPLLNGIDDSATSEEIADFIINKSLMAADMKEVKTFDEVIKMAVSGFAVVLIDGVKTGIALGAQGFNFRSVTEPSGEINERGSREGFTEPLKINLTMIRRRVKSGALKIEMGETGEESKTDYALVYMNADKRLIDEIKKRLSKVKIKTVLDTGYIEPFLQSKRGSIFSSVGVTERPDTLVAKITEGRVAVLLDGTPFALIVPYLFSENFQSFDDYAQRPFFASFVRVLKYVSFFFTIYLPGIYVALSTFHPETLPHALLFNIASAEEATPFPLVLSALIIHLIYEIMREAGLRLPRPVGHAVGIVGALVIGDAAVTAGLIGSPMVMVVALTAISSFVVPSLYAPVSILRFVMIIAGGLTGIYGISILSGMVIINICSVENFGVCYTSPITPFKWSAMRDTFIRIGWKKMQKREGKIR